MTYSMKSIKKEVKKKCVNYVLISLNQLHLSYCVALSFATQRYKPALVVDSMIARLLLFLFSIGVFGLVNN